MDPLYLTIQLLEKKLQALVAQYNHQQERIVQLEKENKRLVDAWAKQRVAYSSTAAPYKLADLCAALPTDEQPLAKDILKRQLEQYIHYVDECIAFVNATK